MNDTPSGAIGVWRTRMPNSRPPMYASGAARREVVRLVRVEGWSRPVLLQQPLEDEQPVVSSPEPFALEQRLGEPGGSCRSFVSFPSSCVDSEMTCGQSATLRSVARPPSFGRSGSPSAPCRSCRSDRRRSGNPSRSGCRPGSGRAAWREARRWGVSDAAEVLVRGGLVPPPENTKNANGAGGAGPACRARRCGSSVDAATRAGR